MVYQPELKPVSKDNDFVFEINTVSCALGDKGVELMTWTKALARKAIESFLLLNAAIASNFTQKFKMASVREV